MKGERGWANDSNGALLTDLYELIMLRADFEEGTEQEAVNAHRPIGSPL
jgi:hypothetical protein